MDKDYGLDGEFMVLAGQCFEYTENQYTYKMCPFDHASQREKHGGGDTRLGSWGSWEGPAGARYTLFFCQLFCQQKIFQSYQFLHC